MSRFWTVRLTFGRGRLSIKRRDDDVSAITRKLGHVAGVGGCDNRASVHVSCGDHERIDCVLGSGSYSPEKLAGAHADRRVDWMYDHSLTPKAGEDRGVGGPASHDFGEHRGNRRNRLVAAVLAGAIWANSSAERSRHVRCRLVKPAGRRLSAVNGHG
jgi:hypothetical protein